MIAMMIKWPNYMHIGKLLDTTVFSCPKFITENHRQTLDNIFSRLNK